MLKMLIYHVMYGLNERSLAKNHVKNVSSILI